MITLLQFISSFFFLFSIVGVISSAAQNMAPKIDEVVRPKVTRDTITVGGVDADLKDYTCEAIQTAIDALNKRGGGTVKLNPGTYKIKAPVKLASNMSLVGSGENTILCKIDGVRTHFIIDADYGELKLTVHDASGFVPGMGVQIYDERQKGGWAVSTAIITGVDRKVIYIDDYLVRDYRADHNGILSNACSIVSAINAENVTIANLAIEGNKENNDFINGCRGGGIYLHKVKDAIIENVLVKNFNGDGISWQITEDVIVRNCEVTGCSNSGLHPGTGSPRSLIEGNTIHHNERDGLFICWRVQHGIVRNNKFHENGRFGLCTGHKDTDMLFEGNQIFENGKDGVHFRGERESNAPHRNVFRENTIENNGTVSGGYGISFNSPARDVLLENNIIRDTSKGHQQAGVYIYKNGLPVRLKNNKMSGHKLGNEIFEKKEE